MNSRRLTISCRYPEVRARHGEHVRSEPMPFLRLQGRWLDQAGFPIGAQVQVQVNQGRLVLEVIGAVGGSSVGERTESPSARCTVTSPHGWSSK
ncbi:SymE family type I addiction module toxin [Steroidobacter cummioxidans]|uniref:SymE family type I addiction module toxin n=1 Tax=Steroidobacter cummioxidans TaxID=1803913 RepID=UPI001474D801